MMKILIANCCACVCVCVCIRYVPPLLRFLLYRCNARNVATIYYARQKQNVNNARTCHYVNV